MIGVEVNVTEVAAAENVQFDRLREVLQALTMLLVDKTDRMNAEEYVSGLLGEDAVVELPETDKELL